VSGVADALEAVHAAGIVHRDLKPANVMFRPDGGPVLIDFGVAKSLTESSDITRAGLAVGTPHYMSPEQVDGRTPDARSDLYGLGVMFFEMLTSCVPYSAATAMAVLYKHKHAPIPELRPSLAALQPLINRFLAKAPEERFQSVPEIREALTSLPKL
jgi:serine/threonine-protein kinase PpkA